MIPFLNFEEDFLTTEDLLFMAGASGVKGVEDTATGNPVIFLTDLAKPLKSLLIPFTPVQSGTGDPSPDNIRPIVPWDGLKVWQSGKNILTGNFQNGVLALENGGTSYNPNYIVSDFIPVKPLTSYYFRCPTVVSSELDIVYYDKDKHYIGYTDADGYSSCNTPGRLRKTPAGCYYVRIDARNAQYNNDICINYPASVTEYVPVVGVTETDIVFPSPVYGGEHEAVSGKLTVKRVGIFKKWKDGINPSVGASYTRKIFNFDVPVKGAATYAYQRCNVAPQDWSTDEKTHFYIDENKAYLWLPNDTDGELEIQFVAVLVTPQEIQLTPQQITALIGNNTVWSDGNGDCEVTYYKKG